MMIVVKLMDQSRLLEQCVRGDRWPKGEQHNRAECPGESHSLDNTNKWRMSQSFFWTDLHGFVLAGGSLEDEGPCSGSIRPTTAAVRARDVTALFCATDDGDNFAQSRVNGSPHGQPVRRRWHQPCGGWLSASSAMTPTIISRTVPTISSGSSEAVAMNPSFYERGIITAAGLTRSYKEGAGERDHGYRTTWPTRCLCQKTCKISGAVDHWVLANDKAITDQPSAISPSTSNWPRSSALAVASIQPGQQRPLQLVPFTEPDCCPVERLQ